ncbi:MAG: glycosyltransferase [Phycisphaerales bacterium]|nr:glycosyltransferase [Phycisphaerales bacterium]
MGRLAAAQTALGHEVRILATACPDRAAAVEQSLRDIPGIAAVARPILPPHSIRSALGGFPLSWRDQITGMEMLHLHGVWEPLLLAVTQEARRLGIPYAIAPHGMLYPWSMTQKRWKKKVAMLLGYRRMLNRAAFIHVLNTDERDATALQKLHAPLQILPNGIFTHEVASLPTAFEFRKAHPQLADRPFILFLARLHPGKGLNHLAQAFAIVAAAHEQAQLVVAGPDGQAKEPFQRQIADMNLSDRAHLIGPLYGRDKFAALSAAACFCLPSEHETFSMAITEALACSLPVVISENCHFPEVAEVGAGKVVPLNAQTIANALLEVLNDPDAAKRMGQAGRQLVSERFTWPVIARQSLQAYHAALSH